MVIIQVFNIEVTGAAVIYSSQYSLMYTQKVHINIAFISLFLTQVLACKQISRTQNIGFKHTAIPNVCCCEV